jgi:hypothetical protein
MTGAPPSIQAAWHDDRSRCGIEKGRRGLPPPVSNRFPVLAAAGSSPYSEPYATCMLAALIAAFQDDGVVDASTNEDERLVAV